MLSGDLAGVPQFCALGGSRWGSAVFCSLPLPPCWSLSHFVLILSYLLGVADNRLGFSAVAGASIGCLHARYVLFCLSCFVSFALSACVSIFYSCFICNVVQYALIMILIVISIVNLCRCCGKRLGGGL